MKKHIFLEIISVVIPIIFLIILFFDFNIDNNSFIIYIILNLLFINYSFLDNFKTTKKDNNIKISKLLNIFIFLPILCSVFILIIELLIANDSKVLIFKITTLFNMLASIIFYFIQKRNR